VGEFLQELFEVKGGAVGAVVDFLEEAEDELVLGVESERAGGEEDLADIGPALTGVCVEGEEGMQFGDALGSEDGVLGSDVLGQHGLEFLLLDFSLRHGS
jgi:hypothetical protein